MNLKALIKTFRAATNIVEWMGGAIFNGSVTATGGFTASAGRIVGVLTTLTYGVSIAIDASLGNDFVVTITDGVAFAIAAPTNPPASGDQVINITFRNASGGAHGAGTFNAIYKTAAAGFVAIGNGNSRTYTFRWNGTNWVEWYRSAADVAN